MAALVQVPGHAHPAAEPAPKGTSTLSPAQLVEIYRHVRLGRAFDERMWLLNRGGQVAFVMPHQGHEACQAGAGMAINTGTDWVVPYYRDLTLSLVMGMTAEELMLGFYAKAADPSCAGRQMLAHYGKASLQYVTGGSCVAMHILHAVGVAQALKMQGDGAACLTTFGEGAASEGDFHEGVSFAAIHKLPVVFLCQNNQYAISVPASEQMPVSVAQRAAGYGIPGVQVDGRDPVAVHAVTQEAMERARAGDGPTIIEALLYRTTAHSSDDDDSRYRTREEVETEKHVDPVLTFRARLLTLGMLTEDEAAEIDSMAAAVVESAQAAAEAAPDPDPATLTFNVVSDHPRDDSADALDEPGIPEGDGPQRTILEAVREALGDEMEHDPRVFVFGQDVAVGGVFRATEGLRDRFGAARCFSTPIAESQIAGTAIGAAFAGLRPVAEIQFSDYSYPAFNQIVNEAARSRYRTNGDFPCPIVVRMPFGGGVHGALYHSQSPEAIYCHTPGLKVIAPSNPYDAKGLLIAAIRDPDPVIFLEHKKAYRMIKGFVPEGPYTLPIGRARLSREGSDVSVITYGLMVHQALKAAAHLAQDGINVEVLDLRTLKPIDVGAVTATVRKTGKVLLLSEANPVCAITSELCMLINEQAFEYLDAAPVRLTGPDSPAMPFATPLEEAFLPNTERVTEALRSLAAS